MEIILLGVSCKFIIHDAAGFGQDTLAKTIFSLREAFLLN